MLGLLEARPMTLADLTDPTAVRAAIPHQTRPGA